MGFLLIGMPGELCTGVILCLPAPHFKLHFMFRRVFHHLNIGMYMEESEPAQMDVGNVKCCSLFGRQLDSSLKSEAGAGEMAQRLRACKSSRNPNFGTQHPQQETQNCL